MSAGEFALTLSCPDRPGIVAAIASAISGNGANIFEAQQYNDRETGEFFARIAFSFVGENRMEALRTQLAAIGQTLRMSWTVHDVASKKRVLILVSRFDHCLADLLYRWRIGELAMDVVGIAANYPRDTYLHDNLDGIPFTHLQVTRENKSRSEAEIIRIVEEQRVDLIVLARYMQILSQDLATTLSGRCINIHHSFLPGFKGARPYHQAHARGVKLIGATAHYVTADLDEGPIIEQDVERVTHHDTPETLVRKGRDIERRVLSRAVAWHLDGRVILNGSKTVVFKD